MAYMRSSAQNGGADDAAAPAGREGGRLAASGLALDGLDSVLGLHLRMAQAVVSRQFLDRLAPLELTQKQTAVLWLVGANPGVSQVALATTLGMDRATMMAIVDRLESRELLTRKRSTEDARRTALTLTKPGRETLAAAKEAVGEHERYLESLLTGGEAAALVGILKRLYAAS